MKQSGCGRKLLTRAHTHTHTQLIVHHSLVDIVILQSTESFGEIYWIEFWLRPVFVIVRLCCLMGRRSHMILLLLLLLVSYSVVGFGYRTYILSQLNVCFDSICRYGLACLTPWYLWQYKYTIIDGILEEDSLAIDFYCNIDFDKSRGRISQT